ncbi:polysaccharide lyase [Dehalobacter sp. TBBPA1]|uniref:polysaccharide lyase n=1 Tax=Dehalobacter sp. TBBPA1 TaxID=3235037 RepID=UPI0034A20545
MKKVKAVFGLIVFVSLLFNTTVASAAAVSKNKENQVNRWGGQLIESPMFENDILLNSAGKKLSSYWNREMANNTYSGAVSGEFLLNGLSSYRIELRKDDKIVNGSKRSEIAAVRPCEALAEKTYTFSTYLPDGGSEDYAYDPQGSEIIAQWHNTPDPGEDWTYPPLALHTGAYYTNDAGHYILESNWDPSPMSTDEQIDNNGTRARYDLGSYIEDKGKWVTWTFHIKWGWLESQNPILEVYKNGEKILDLNGLPNTMNDKVGTVMKLGVYKWDWAQSGSNNKSILSKRVVYYSNVSVE